jgi:hypothetical protein
MEEFVNPLSRRDFLRIGTVAVAGSGGPPATAASSKRAAQAVILIFLDGGTSHIDLFDMKPDAAAEVRGPFRPIRTTVPGVPVCEHLPRLAQRMHKVLQLRSVHHTDAVHDPAVYLTLTGKRHPTPLGGLRVSPDDDPHVGGLFAALSHRTAAAGTQVPGWFELPETMKMEGRTLPGQNGGFLGQSADPFRCSVASDGTIEPPNLGLPEGVETDRLLLRGNLRFALDRKLAGLDSTAFDAVRGQAVELLASSTFRSAFDLSAESERTRDRYGRHRHGQSVLLARRLAEAGARFVTVNWGKEEQDWADGVKKRVANNPWDTHRNHFPLLKDSLLPRADQALAALLDDLADRGLNQVLTVWMSEFGRTPLITKPWASRDHWPGANTILLAGAGIAGGHVLGRTDAKAAAVTDFPVMPADVAATILAALGCRGGDIQTRQRRPIAACDGTPIDRVYTG